MSEQTGVPQETIAKLPYIIAIDFDGTLVENCYPKMGRIKEVVLKRALSAQRQGAKLILWTCRHAEFLEEAIGVCAMNGLRFDAINDNLPEVVEMFDNNCRKVFANEYWDDKVPFENWMMINSAYN